MTTMHITFFCLGGSNAMSRSPSNSSPEMPPPLPDPFSPADDVTNPEGNYRWYKNWVGKSAEAYGITGLYDPNEDRVIVENRLMEYEAGDADSTYTHSDMVEDMLSAGAFVRFPDTTVAGECGGVEIGGQMTFSGEIPTVAGGTFVSTRRVGDNKEIIGKDDPEMTPTYLYKFVHTLALLDFPAVATISTTYSPKNTRRGRGATIESRRFELQDAYAELQFEGMLPEPVVDKGFSV